MYAIIISGGKQHKVEEGQEVLLEKIKGEPGDTIEVGEPIFLSTNGDRVYSSEELSKVKVKAEIVEQTRNDKIIVFKYKPKKGYRRKRGHKQLLTKVRIEDISFPGKPEKQEKPEPPKEKTQESKKAAAARKPKPKDKTKVKTKAKAKAKSEQKPAKTSRTKRKTKKDEGKSK